MIPFCRTFGIYASYATLQFTPLSSNFVARREPTASILTSHSDAFNLLSPFLLLLFAYRSICTVPIAEVGCVLRSVYENYVIIMPESYFVLYNLYVAISKRNPWAIDILKQLCLKSNQRATSGPRRVSLGGP